MNQKSNLLAYLLLIPSVALLFCFVFYPAAHALYLSFHEVEPFSQATFFIGLENYVALLTSSEYWRCIWISLKFTIMTVIPSVVGGLGLALLLDSRPFFQRVLRTIFLLPIAISSAMAAMLWIFLFNPTAGFINHLFGLIGLEGPNWLADPKWALVSVSIATVWKEIGFNIVFFTAGLSTIPTEMKEASLVDGAGALQRFRHVTLPLLSPTLYFVITVSFVHAMESFGQIHILTKGGPMGETSTLVYELYREAFTNFRSGLASTEAVLLFCLLLVGTSLQFRVAKRRVHYG